MAKKNVLTRAKKQQALAFMQQGNPAEAKPLLEKICRTDRTDVDAQFMLGIANGMLGEHVRAEQSFRQILKLFPNHPDANNNLGLSLCTQGRCRESLTYFERALQQAPDNAEFMFNYANAFEELRAFKQARAWYEKAIDRAPGYPDAYCNLGNVLQAQGEYAAAIAAFEHAISLSADFVHDYPQIYINLGNALMELGRDDEAVQAYQRAAQTRSDFAEAYLALGNAYLQQGRNREAIDSLQRAIATKSPNGKAYHNLVQTRRFSKRDNDIEAMETAYRDPGLADEEKIYYAFALGKVYADLEDEARSFEYYLMGNRLKRESIEYTIEEDRKLFAAIRQVFSLDFIHKHEHLGIEDATPIFIIGMPRSGTSLTEQILASHSQVHGAGELNDMRHVIESVCDKHSGTYPQALLQLDEGEQTQIATDYLARLHAYAQSAQRISDKMPHNFLYVGLIRLLLPKAKVIHCQRNPMDNALSIFKELFAKGHNYAYDLEELGHYYRLYQDLMHHWRTVVPNSFYDLSYEDLVSDQELQTRRLLEYCELPWEDTCLAFHRTQRVVRTASLVQVRQPIHTKSVEGWRRFEQQLQPFIHALEVGYSA